MSSAVWPNRVSHIQRRGGREAPEAALGLDGVSAPGSGGRRHGGDRRGQWNQPRTMPNNLECHIDIHGASGVAAPTLGAGGLGGWGGYTRRRGGGSAVARVGWILQGGYCRRPEIV